MEIHVKCIRKWNIDNNYNSEFRLELSYLTSFIFVVLQIYVSYNIRSRGNDKKNTIRGGTNVHLITITKKSWE